MLVVWGPVKVCDVARMSLRRLKEAFRVLNDSLKIANSAFLAPLC